MKHFIAISAAALALAFTACDNIDEKDRFIPLEFQETDKVILIEEFTGANCTNCPTGAATVTALHEQYGDQIIAVSLYPKQLTDLTRPYNVDLRTDIATEIFAQYNKENGIPAAMFNRNMIDGYVLQLTPNTWGTPVYNILQNKESSLYSPYSPAKIELSSTYDAETRELKIEYLTEFLHNVDESVSFQIYILENNIISIQNSLTGMIRNYENNHVLRTALNGTWGKDFGGNHAAGTNFTGENSVTLDPKWNADNIQVVGILCQTGGNHTVLHAAQIKSIVNE